jgi:hypothetical protein
MLQLAVQTTRGNGFAPLACTIAMSNREILATLAQRRARSSDDLVQ